MRVGDGKGQGEGTEHEKIIGVCDGSLFKIFSVEIFLVDVWNGKIHVKEKDICFLQMELVSHGIGIS